MNVWCVSMLVERGVACANRWETC